MPLPHPASGHLGYGPPAPSNHVSLQKGVFKAADVPWLCKWNGSMPAVTFNEDGVVDMLCSTSGV
jgi:hypothetical protein